jgi:hypothetical protein
MKLPALKEIIDERKDAAIEKLSDSFAKNKLPLEEYERLVEYIQKIESERELVVVEKIVREYAVEYGSSELPKESADEDEEDEIDYYHHHAAHQSSSLTFLSSRTLSGPVKSGAQYVSILGSEHIKIRRADLDKHRTVLNVVSILGDSVIFVESGIRVSNEAIPILGGAWTDHKVGKNARAGEPELVIRGAALLGNITVKQLKE